MIDTLHALGLTDWSSFFWGIGTMFVIGAILTGLITWACHNAPEMNEYEEEYWA